MKTDSCRFFDISESFSEKGRASFGTKGQKEDGIFAFPAAGRRDPRCGNGQKLLQFIINPGTNRLPVAVFINGNALLWLLSVELCAAASGYTARERRRLGNNPSRRSCGSNRANEISWNLHGNTDSWSRSVQPGRYSLGHGFSQLSYQMRHGTTDKF